MSTTSEGSWRFTGLGLKVHPKTTLAHPSTFQEECPKVPAETTLIHLTSHLLPASLEILPRRQDVALSCGAQCGRFVCAFVRFPEPLLTWMKQEASHLSGVWSCLPPPIPVLHLSFQLLCGLLGGTHVATKPSAGAHELRRGAPVVPRSLPEKWPMVVGRPDRGGSWTSLKP